MDREQVPITKHPLSESSLRLKKSLGKGKKSVVIKCLPGAITILTDEMGTTLRDYTNCLQGKADRQTVLLEYDGQIDTKNIIKLVGFDEELPEVTIPQYLLANGVDDSVIESLIDEFELRNHLFLLCSQLSKTVARQVQLLAAVGSNAPIVVLNDPFQPFSGRWREAFGEYLFHNCIETNRIYVCANLSFIPNMWLGKSNVTAYDVGAILEKAKQRDADPTKVATKEAVKRQNVNELNEKYYKAPFKISVPIPDSVIAASQSTQEIIVRNLANIGTFLREWTSPIFFAAIAVISILAGVMLSYDVGGSRAKIQMVIQKITEQNKEQSTKLQTNPSETIGATTEDKEASNKSEQEPDSNKQQVHSDEAIVEETNITPEQPELILDNDSLMTLMLVLGIQNKASVMTDALMSYQEN